jgi:hypothetical protein
MGFGVEPPGIEPLDIKPLIFKISPDHQNGGGTDMVLKTGVF